MKGLSDEIASKVDVAIVDETMRMLKDFQRATVERVDYLFCDGQRRVLVADEVGLGKTMIAKGVIALMAQRLCNESKKTFKVIYVCSNQSIAKQNISDLDVFGVGYETDIANTRLSMQHLYIERTNPHKPVQLISLTPQTSFNQKSGQGMVNERVLIYCVLEQMPEFENNDLRRKLEQMLMYRVSKNSWKWGYERFNAEVRSCKTEYLESLHAFVREEDGFKRLQEYLHSRSQTEEGSVAQGDLEQVIFLRKLFAKISVRQLKPDLVIMDEFQNFQFLLNTEDAEIKALTDCFFGNTESHADSEHRTNVLLLSATPYKLYTTLEEMGDTNSGDHYSEFMAVMKFLYNEDGRFSTFNSVWQDYSTILKEISENGTTMIVAKNKKNAAENEMYGAVCRTERISVMDNVDYIDDSSKDKTLTIMKEDVESYMQAAGLMQCIDSRFRVEYVKSCPFPLSFMNNYVEKKRLREFFKQNPADVGKANKSMLWVDKRKINGYKELPAVNARFEQLKKKIFTKYAELLLWMPPACPYYEPYGVYDGQEDFSKILIFSSWEMVPRMIGSLVSYEEERRTIGRLVGIHKDRIDEQSQRYFVHDTEKRKRSRYPTGRLRPSVHPMFSLIYPSNALKEIYEPMSCLSKGVRRIGEIENCIKEKIKNRIKTSLHVDYDTLVNKDGNKDRRWYYLGPMVLDDPEDVVRWMDGVASNIKEHGDDNLNIEETPYGNVAGDGGDGGSKSLSGVLATMRRLFVDENGNASHPDMEKMGPLPADFLDVMASLAIASPAVCLYRTLGNSDVAARVARNFVRYFNSPENTAIVELAFHDERKKQSEDSHWLDVLNYCKMGNIQAMLDEFVHLLRKGRSIEHELKNIEARFHECLTLHSSPYNVESYFEFKASVKSGKTIRPSKRLRTHYGAGFSKSDSADKAIARKDNLRNAFNSPFWPFVLASTSIGQEGLDFHLYCRKIMHWNLPANPVELEQREGRINRYKCLAIRQNVARKYSVDIKDVVNDCWDEMFKMAYDERAEGQSELIPYWCFGKEQKVKIERILPLYPISRDTDSYDRLIKLLSLYRLTLGQTRQEDLLEHVFDNFEEPDKLQELFIDLSPFNKKGTPCRKEGNE